MFAFVFARHNSMPEPFSTNEFIKMITASPYIMRYAERLIHTPHQKIDVYGQVGALNGNH